MKTLTLILGMVMLAGCTEVIVDAPESTTEVTEAVNLKTYDYSEVSDMELDWPGRGGHDGTYSCFDETKDLPRSESCYNRLEQIGVEDMGYSWDQGWSRPLIESYKNDPIGWLQYTGWQLISVKLPDRWLVLRDRI
jgi:hypothetical protein